MKTIKIRIVTKDTNADFYACGSCFVKVDFEDSYCWSCGSTLSDNESVDDYAELKKVNEEEKEE